MNLRQHIHISAHILPALLSLGLFDCHAAVESTIRGAVSPRTEAGELVVCRYDEDPRESTCRISVDDGKFGLKIDADEIMRYKIIDLGEVLEKGHTSRYGYFFVEEGAEIEIEIDGNDVAIQSTGEVFREEKAREQAAEELFAQRIADLENLPDSIRDTAEERLGREYGEWELDYHSRHPGLPFLFELAERMSSFHFTDDKVSPMLEIYEKQGCADLYPGHSIHSKISALAESGLQMKGSAYHDYDAYDLDGNTVRASDYLSAGKPAVVIIWATWCAPCRREALDMIPVYERYSNDGVDFIGLAREFKSTDAIREAVKKDRHPWPTLLDLDDRFGIFKRHGTSSSGLYLIDREGKIAATGYDFDEIKPALDLLLQQATPFAPPTANAAQGRGINFP